MPGRPPGAWARLVEAIARLDAATPAPHPSRPRPAIAVVEAPPIDDYRRRRGALTEGELYAALRGTASTEYFEAPASLSTDLSTPPERDPLELSTAEADGDA